MFMQAYVRSVNADLKNGTVYNTADIMLLWYYKCFYKCLSAYVSPMNIPFKYSLNVHVPVDRE